MNLFLDWGIPIITWLQALSSWLTPVMETITFLGDEQFYLLILPIFVWWVDVGLGLRIGISLLLSAGLNDILKLTFGLPRPYWVDTRVQALSEGTSFGFPSGHSQNALVVWGRLAAWINKGWASIVLGLLILLISISRMYLGVHYPTDVLGGWLVGGILLWALIRFDAPVRNWLKGMSVGGQITITTIVSALTLALGTLAYVFSPGKSLGYPLPPGVDPHIPDGFITAAGTLFGMGVGGALLYDWGAFRTNVGWPKRVGRYILGVAGLLALYLGLSAVFPSGETLISAIFRFVRYGLLGLWVLYLAPRLFNLLRLD